MSKSRNQRIVNGRITVDEIVQAYTQRQSEIDPTLLKNLTQYTRHSDRAIREQVLAYAADNLPKCPLLADVVLEGAARHNIRNQAELISALKNCNSSLVRKKLEHLVNESSYLSVKRDIAAVILGREKPSVIAARHFAERQERNKPDPPETLLEAYVGDPTPARLDVIRESIASNRFGPLAWVKALQPYTRKGDPRVLPLIRELLQGNLSPSIQAAAAEGAGRLKDRQCVSDLLRIATSPYVAEPPRVTGYSDGHMHASGFQKTLETLVVVREAAIGALAEIGDESVVEPLEAYLRRLWTERGAFYRMYYVRDYLGKISVPIEDYGHLRIIGQLAHTLSTFGAAQILDVLAQIRSRMGNRKLDFGEMEYRGGNLCSCWAACWDRITEATQRLNDRPEDAPSA